MEPVLSTGTGNPKIGNLKNIDFLRFNPIFDGFPSEVRKILFNTFYKAPKKNPSRRFQNRKIPSTSIVMTRFLSRNRSNLDARRFFSNSKIENLNGPILDINLLYR